MLTLGFSIFQFVVLIFSVMIHEIAHGVTAERLGDPTARLAGRLTLNPLKHIDPFGSVFLPALLVLTSSPIVLGWAKPVPYNPQNLYKDYRYGPLKVALAGPVSNLLLLLVFGLLARGSGVFISPLLGVLFSSIAFVNAFLAIFNLIPIPPLDGSKLLTLILPSRYAYSIEQLGFAGFFFLMLLLFSMADYLYTAAFYLVHTIAGPAALGM